MQAEVWIRSQSWQSGNVYSHLQGTLIDGLHYDAACQELPVGLPHGVQCGG